MAYETLLVDVADGVMTITLNRPDKLNAFTSVMLAEMTVALDAAEKEEAVRAILITGAGRGFCAGQDLGDRKVISDDIDLGASLEERYNPLVKRLRALPKPVICAVNGVAAGAGANFALCCDIVLAAESASFIQAFARIGLVPDCGGTWLLPRLVGWAKACEIAFTGRTYTAHEALALGLVNQVVPHETFAKEVRAFADEIAANAPLAVQAIKRMMRLGLEDTFESNVHQVYLQLLPLFRTKDFQEGVKAFLERRPPRFEGR